MFVRLARASRRSLLQRRPSPSPLVELPSFLFSHNEGSAPSERNHPRHLKTLDPPSFLRSISHWIRPTDHRQLRQNHVELTDRLHRSLLFPAAISSSSGRDEERGKRQQASITSASWVDRNLPRPLQPYAFLARLDKPIGTWLLAWPCAWSITIAASPGSFPDLKMLTLFGSGAVLLRGAGCTVNDLLDRDIDNKVERTKSRPIASGLLTPFQGLSFLGFQLLLGLGILLQLNNFRCIIVATGFLLSPDEENYILAASIFRFNL
uniref:4-hydroxybenzoate polyprenyltransferase, mitochondrial n=1 Tax=Anthurium amnicola TaxID=1678845 RepID=A0A1D1YRU4_9ARAE